MLHIVLKILWFILVPLLLLATAVLDGTTLAQGFQWNLFVTTACASWILGFLTRIYLDKPMHYSIGFLHLAGIVVGWGILAITSILSRQAASIAVVTSGVMGASLLLMFYEFYLANNRLAREGADVGQGEDA